MPHERPSYKPSAAPEPVSEEEASPGHLSETVKMDQWLRLLVVLTACLLIVLSIAVAVRLLAFIGHTLLLFSLGGLLAYAFAPLAERARKRGGRVVRPRWIGVLTVYGSLLLILVLATALLSAEAVHQVSNLARDHIRLEAEGRVRLASLDD